MPPRQRQHQQRRQAGDDSGVDDQADPAVNETSGRFQQEKDRWQSETERRGQSRPLPGASSDELPRSSGFVDKVSNKGAATAKPCRPAMTRNGPAAPILFINGASASTQVRSGGGRRKKSRGNAPAGEGKAVRTAWHRGATDPAVRRWSSQGYSPISTRLHTRPELGFPTPPNQEKSPNSQPARVALSANREKFG